MKSVTRVLISVLLTVSFMTSTVFAEGLKITPGLWQSTSTMTNSMTGSTTQTTENCVVEEEFDPMTMMEGAQGCELTENELDGNTLQFAMACNIQGAESVVQGVYTVDGDNGEGSMSIEMSFGGQTMTMENVFTASRIGDC